MATKILEKFKQRLTGLELEPSDGGCFELTVDGQLVYSKMQTGQFPDEDAMVSEVGNRI